MTANLLQTHLHASPTLQTTLTDQENKIVTSSKVIELPQTEQEVVASLSEKLSSLSTARSVTSSLSSSSLKKETPNYTMEYITSKNIMTVVQYKVSSCNTEYIKKL